MQLQPLPLIPMSLFLFTFAMKCSEKSEAFTFCKRDNIEAFTFCILSNSILQSRPRSTTSTVSAAFLPGTALAGTDLQLFWFVYVFLPHIDDILVVQHLVQCTLYCAIVAVARTVVSEHGTWKPVYICQANIALFNGSKSGFYK